jgi:hypothetical protein
MAETPVERYRRQLRELEERRIKDEIGAVEYFAEIDRIRPLLKESQEIETQLLETPGAQTTSKYFDVRSNLYGYDTRAIDKLASDYMKEGANEKIAYQKAFEKLGKETREQRYGTGEFVKKTDIQDPSFAVSDIVDPEKGLIQDPQTGLVRKATDWEMLTSAIMERQRKPTQLTTQEAREQFEKNQQDYIEDLRTQRKIDKLRPQIQKAAYSRTPFDMRKSLKSIELTKEEEESIQRQAKESGPLSRLDVRQDPESPAVIAETPLEYGFRVINTVGAVLDPAVGYLQDAIGTLTGAPPKIRKERFKKTQIEGLGGQILTNLLTGQSSFDRIQAGLLPPDETASWYDVTTEGTPASLALTLLPAAMEPLTPLPGVKAVTKGTGALLRTSKTAAAQKAARMLESPIDAIMYGGRRAQIKDAVESIGIKDGAKKIEQQILKDGGVLNRASLRKKASESIGDQYATRMNAKRIVEQYDADAVVWPTDFGNPNNIIVKEIFKGATEVPVSRVKEVIDSMDEVFKGVAAGSKGEVKQLRRTLQVSEETVKKMFANKKPLRDRAIINRAIARAHIENPAYWENAFRLGHVPKQLQKVWKKGYEIVKSQSQKLSSKELETLGKTYDILQKRGVFDPTKVKSTPKDAYNAVRNAVSDVVNDNFLKDIPDDMIYMGKNVSVPYKNIVRPFRGDTPQYKRFKETIRSFNIKESMTASDAAKTKRYAQIRGIELPSSIKTKLDDMVKGKKETFTTIESNNLLAAIQDELAIDLLDGVRLETGSLTADVSVLGKGAERTTLIGVGERGSFRTWAAGVSNSLKIILSNSQVAKRYTKGIDLKIKPQMSVVQKQFASEIARISNQSMKEVEEFMKATNPETFNADYANVIDQYLDTLIDRRMSTGRIGREFEIDRAQRQEFLGEVDFEKVFAAEQQEKITLFKQAREALYQKNLEDMIGIVNTQTERKWDEAFQYLTKIYEKERARLFKSSGEGIDLYKNEMQNLKKAFEEQFDFMREAAMDYEKNIASEIIKELPKRHRLKKIAEKTERDLQKMMDRFTTKVERAQIESTKRSEVIAVKRKLSILAEKYGRDNINTYVNQQLGKKTTDIATYEEIASVVDDLERDMPVAIDQIFRVKIWKDHLKDFFYAPPGVNALDPRFIDEVSELVRKDASKPYWSQNNVLPLTIENFKYVIEQLRKRNPNLKKYGLQTLFGKGEEVIILPFIKRMHAMKTTMNTQQVVDDFIENSPDLFIQMNRSQDATLGLSATKDLADKLLDDLDEAFKSIQKKGLRGKYPIKETKQGTVTKKGAAYKKYNKALKKQDKTYDSNFILDSEFDRLYHQIRTTLFDGMAKDIWANGGRKTQKAFFDAYLKQMINNKSPFVESMNDFVVGLYTGPNPVLTSNTFRKVADQVNKVFQRIDKRFDTLSIPFEQQKLYERLKEDFGSIVDGMQNQYLNNITLRGEGLYDGLFSQQLQDMTSYMQKFGIDDDTLIESVRNQFPRIEYIGERNIAIIHGDVVQTQMKQVFDIINNARTKQFLSKMQEKYAQGGIVNGKYIRNLFGDVANVSRRWTITRMLTGIEPLVGGISFRFPGMNRITASVLYMASLGSSTMKASTAAKFAGLSVTMGLGPVATKALRAIGFKDYAGFLKSNRVLHAPAEEVIISTADGGLRNYTAGELREIMVRENIEFSRADSDFYDTQFNRIMIDSGMNKDGSVRYGKEKLQLPATIAKATWDNLSPSGRNIFTEFAKMQDTEMRRFVFFEALRDGENIQQAASKARKSMLDYGSLTPIEREHISKFIYFYSFMRTMGVETINSFYRGVVNDNFNPMVGMLRLQGKINRDTEERAMNDMTRSRMFNVFVRLSEGIDDYVSGPVNPAVSAFELITTGAIAFMNSPKKMTQEERLLELSLHEITIQNMNRSSQGAAQVAGNVLNTVIEGSPIIKIVSDYINAETTPFPSELIDQATQNGNLEEVVKRYNLEPRKRVAGRPLSRIPLRSSTGEIIYPAGVYYDFSDDVGKRQYLADRLIGLTALAEVWYHFGGSFASITRGAKENIKAEMFAYQDPRIETPTGVERMPTESVYLKSANQQDLDMNTNLMYALYQLGILTPLKVSKREVIMERILDRTIKKINDLEYKEPER